MGQEEVIKALRKADRPLTTKEISALIDIGARSVRRIIKDLQEDCFVNLKTKRMNQKEMKEKYGKVLKTPKIRLYFLQNQ